MVHYAEIGPCVGHVTGDVMLFDVFAGRIFHVAIGPYVGAFFLSGFNGFFSRLEHAEIRFIHVFVGRREG